MVTDSSANESDEHEALYTLFYIGNSIYGIIGDSVLSIENLNDVTALAGAPAYIRGGVFLNGEFIELIDMRKFFKIDSQMDELINSVHIEQRLKEHDIWMSTLERSVTEGIEFHLADEAAKCEFGKWLIAFKTNNNILSHQLKRISKAHDAMHEASKNIKKLAKANNRAAAKTAVEELRAGHYRTTTDMLMSLRDIVSSSLKEIYIAIKSNGNTIGIIVDAIVGLETLNEEFSLPDSAASASYVRFISRRRVEKTPVMVLDVDMLK